jgi:hypothetical protein
VICTPKEPHKWGTPASLLAYPERFRVTQM